MLIQRIYHAVRNFNNPERTEVGLNTNLASLQQPLLRCSLICVNRKIYDQGASNFTALHTTAAFTTFITIFIQELWFRKLLTPPSIKKKQVMKCQARFFASSYYHIRLVYIYLIIICIKIITLPFYTMTDIGNHINISSYLYHYD